MSVGDGAEIEYTYDDAGRLTRIALRDAPEPLENTPLEQWYEYSNRDFAVDILESGTVEPGNHSYEYHKRGRLPREQRRVGVAPNVDRTYEC